MKTVVSVVTSPKPTISDEPAGGFAPGAVMTFLEAKNVQNITIVRDGKPAITIRITPEGHLMVTNHKGAFQTGFTSSLLVENTNPWTT